LYSLYVVRRLKH